MIDSVSPLHPSELDTRKDTCARKCSERNKQSAESYQRYYCFHAECSQLVSASNFTTECWKQLRRESLGRRHGGSKSLRFLVFCESDAKSYGCDIFTCTLVSHVTVSALHSRTLPQGPRVSKKKTVLSHTTQHRVAPTSTLRTHPTPSKNRKDGDVLMSCLFLFIAVLALFTSRDSTARPFASTSKVHVHLKTSVRMN